MTTWPPERIALYREELSSEPRAIAALDEIERLQAANRRMNNSLSDMAAEYLMRDQRREQLLRIAMPRVPDQIADMIRAELGGER